jgi:hypothetical protein
VRLGGEVDEGESEENQKTGEKKLLNSSALQISTSVLPRDPIPPKVVSAGLQRKASSCLSKIINCDNDIIDRDIDVKSALLLLFSYVQYYHSIVNPYLHHSVSLFITAILMIT